MAATAIGEAFGNKNRKYRCQSVSIKETDVRLGSGPVEYLSGRP